MAPCNGTTSHSPNHSTLEWHPAMAPSNGTQQWHHIHSPQSWSSPSPSPTIAHDIGTLRWHPTISPRALHSAMAPGCHVQSAKVVRRPPPLLEVRTPYSYRYLGKNLAWDLFWWDWSNIFQKMFGHHQPEATWTNRVIALYPIVFFP